MTDKSVHKLNFVHKLEGRRGRAKGRIALSRYAFYKRENGKMVTVIQELGTLIKNY